MGFREILRVDSPVSNISYVPHVRPPRLPWRKCRDIFEGQHMTRHKKKGPQCDPCLTGDLRKSELEDQSQEKEAK